MSVVPVGIVRTPGSTAPDGIPGWRIGRSTVVALLPLTEITESNEVIEQTREVDPLGPVGVGELGLHAGLDLG